MTGRWRVERGELFWWASGPDSTETYPFTTHAEAIAFADRAARGGVR